MNERIFMLISVISEKHAKFHFFKLLNFSAHQNYTEKNLQAMDPTLRLIKTEQGF